MHFQLIHNYCIAAVISMTFYCLGYTPLFLGFDCLRCVICGYHVSSSDYYLFVAGNFSPSSIRIELCNPGSKHKGTRRLQGRTTLFGAQAAAGLMGEPLYRQQGTHYCQRSVRWPVPFQGTVDRTTAEGQGYRKSPS